MVGRKGGEHNRPGRGNVQRLVDRRGYVTFRGRVTRDGRTHYAEAVGAGIPGRFTKRAWEIAERQAHDRARTLLDALIADLDRDRIDDAEKRRATLNDWLAVWSAEKQAAMRAETRSWDYYETALRLHVVPFLGGVRLSRLGPSTLLRWRKELLEHPTEPRTPDRVHYAERVLRAALKDAHTMRWPVDDTVLKVKRLALPKKAPAPSLSPAQFARLTTVAPEPNRTFYLTCYHAATRAGEARGLTLGRVLFATNQVDVAQQLPQGDSPRDPKWGSSGVVDVPPELIAALDAQRRRLEATLGRTMQPDDYLFFDPETKRVPPWSAWRKRLRDDLAAAGLPDCGLHALRHGAGQAMAEVEGNPLRIQERMRHRSLQTTEQYMQHRPPGAGQATARKVAKAVRRAGSATTTG